MSTDLERKVRIILYSNDDQGSSCAMASPYISNIVKLHFSLKKSSLVLSMNQQTKYILTMNKDGFTQIVNIHVPMDREGVGGGSCSMAWLCKS